MIIVVDLGKDVNAYLEKFGHGGPESVLDCPRCGRRLHGHGRYLRGVKEGVEEAARPVPIYRRRCPGCRTTCALLPHFLRPYSPYTLPRYEAALRRYAGSGRSLEGAAEESDLEARTLRRWLARLARHWDELTSWLARRILQAQPLVENLVRGPFRSARDRLCRLFELGETLLVVLKMPPGPVLPVIHLLYPGVW